MTKIPTREQLEKMSDDDLSGLDGAIREIRRRRDEKKYSHEKKAIAAAIRDAKKADIGKRLADTTFRVQGTVTANIKLTWKRVDECSRVDVRVAYCTRGVLPKHTEQKSEYRKRVVTALKELRAIAEKHGVSERVILGAVGV